MNDWIPIRLSRIAPSGNDLSGDLYVLGFKAEVPTT